MLKNLQQSLNYVFIEEGGFSDRAEEPGGGVNKGVSLLVYAEFRKKKGLSAPTLATLRDITTTEATVIYKTAYWDRMHCDVLSRGVDYMVFDMAVMDGVAGATALLNLAHADDVTRTLENLRMVRIAKKMGSKSWTKFGLSWTNRINRTLDRAKQMAA